MTSVVLGLTAALARLVGAFIVPGRSWALPSLGRFPAVRVAAGIFADAAASDLIPEGNRSHGRFLMPFAVAGVAAFLVVSRVLAGPGGA